MLLDHKTLQCENIPSSNPRATYSDKYMCLFCHAYSYFKISAEKKTQYKEILSLLYQNQQRDWATPFYFLLTLSTVLRL